MSTMALAYVLKLICIKRENFKNYGFEDFDLIEMIYFQRPIGETAPGRIDVARVVLLQFIQKLVINFLLIPY